MYKSENKRQLMRLWIPRKEGESAQKENEMWESRAFILSATPISQVQPASLRTAAWGK